ncbi:hypothetical protein [Chromatium okenii]|uniref:Uncharacterized protein n=1 Tax=Chromatium okenii TaxID=61644 RepID=A0A2S7XPQ0_9GAMM|nr:hypothetical protein [Chromatium okenii]PQJ95533.1 hypothetical protein CXB77_15375 [Chromatium okenii]
MLREIANDPNEFLAQHGGGSLDFTEEKDLQKLQKLYDSLQMRILATLEALAQLRTTSNYELYQLSCMNADFLDEIAAQQIEDIQQEIAILEFEAQQLAEEIEGLQGSPVAF